MENARAREQNVFSLLLWSWIFPCAIFSFKGWSPINFTVVSFRRRRLHRCRLHCCIVAIVALIVVVVVIVTWSLILGLEDSMSSNHVWHSKHFGSNKPMHSGGSVKEIDKSIQDVPELNLIQQSLVLVFSKTWIYIQFVCYFFKIFLDW